MSEKTPNSIPAEGNEDAPQSRRNAILRDAWPVAVIGDSFMEGKKEYYWVDYGGGKLKKELAYDIELTGTVELPEHAPPQPSEEAPDTESEEVGLSALKNFEPGQELEWQGAADPENKSGWKFMQAETLGSGRRVVKVEKAGKETIVPVETFLEEWSAVSTSESAPEKPSEERAQPTPKDESKESRQKKPRQERKKPEYRFENGEIVKVKTKDGKREFEWQVKESFGYKNKFVKLEDPQGERDDIVVPEDTLAEWNPKANDAPEDESKSSKQPDRPKPNNREGGKPPDNKGQEKNEQIDPNNTWLDPRRIQNLKAKYITLLEQEERRRAYTSADGEALRKRIRDGQEVTEIEPVNRTFMRDDSGFSKHYNKILITHLIEREIRRTIDSAKYVADHYKIGKVPKEPSEKIKQQMAAMMDEPMERLNELAAKEDERLNKAKPMFKPGQRVKVVDHNRHTNEWTIDKVAFDPISGTKGYWVTDGKERRWHSEKSLLEYQEQAGNADAGVEKAHLEALKPYIDNPDSAKIKTADGRIVKGQFQGYKTSNGNVYYGFVDDNEPIAHKKSKRLGEVRVSEFLDWQKLPSEDEKLAALEAQLEPYIGMEFKFPKGEALAPVELQYQKDEQIVQYVSESGVEFEATLQEFVEQQLHWIDTIKRVNELPADEKKFDLGQKVKYKDGDELADDWEVYDIIREADGKIWVAIRKGNIAKKEEQENLLRMQGASTESSQDSSSPASSGHDVDDPEKNPKSWKTKATEAHAARWRSRWGGDTPEEKRKNKLRRVRARTINTLGAIAFGPLLVATSPVTGAIINGQHKYIQHKRKKMGLDKNHGH